MQRHPDDREPDGEDRLGQVRPVRNVERDDDLEIGVAHRPNPLPLREEEEEELAEADILDVSDLEDADDLDDLDDDRAEPDRLDR